MVESMLMTFLWIWYSTITRSLCVGGGNDMGYGVDGVVVDICCFVDRDGSCE